LNSGVRFGSPSWHGIAIVTSCDGRRAFARMIWTPYILLCSSLCSCYHVTDRPPVMSVSVNRAHRCAAVTPPQSNRQSRRDTRPPPRLHLWPRYAAPVAARTGLESLDRVYAWVELLASYSVDDRLTAAGQLTLMEPPPEEGAPVAGGFVGAVDRDRDLELIPAVRGRGRRDILAVACWGTVPVFVGTRSR
jgi:hypothetical protein